MAKGKNRKLSKADQALQNKKDERNKRARERRAEIKAAEEAAKRRRQLSSKISYRNSRLKKSVSIDQDDQKDRDRYLKELRALYKEQNPKKNKKLTKKELVHIKNFRDFAQNELDKLRKKPRTYFENLTDAQKKDYIKKIKYFEKTAKRYGKIIDKIEGRKGIPGEPREPEEEYFEINEILDEKLNLLPYELIEILAEDVRSPEYKKVEFYFDGDLFNSVILTLDTRFTIILEAQKFIGYIKNNNFCDYFVVDAIYYTNGDIIVSSDSTKLTINKKARS